VSEYAYRCEHCLHGWQLCPIHPDRWPNATPQTCASFVREVGCDDDLDEQGGKT
jgi:hypothetical protein